MKKTNSSTKDMLVDYLDGVLSENDRDLLEQQLLTDDELKDELDQLKSMVHIMKQDHDEEVPSNLKEGFYNMLEEEVEKYERTLSIQKKKSTFILSTLKIAAAISLLLMSYFYGKYQQSISVEEEFSSLRDENLKSKELAMLSFMENESASTRIKGVSYLDEFSQPGEEILDAIIARMKFDENTNVRLAAVEALENFTSSTKVKEELVMALGIEKNPTIQITIIQILVAIQEKKAIKPIQNLLELEETAPFVKDQIKELLPKFV